MIEDYLGLARQVLDSVDKSIISDIAEKIDHVPAIVGKAIKWATANADEISNLDHPDLFAALGPVYFFNAMCALVERRSHNLACDSEVGFGLTLSGGNPVRVSDVSYHGPAAEAGVKCGDYIIEVSGIDVRGLVASEVEAALQKQAVKDGNNVNIVVVVNYDMQNFEELINPDVPSAVAARVQTLSMPSQWHMMPGSTGAKFNLAGKSPFKLDVVEA